MMAAKNETIRNITLKDLLTGFVETEFLPEAEVSGIALDSRRVEQGYVFVALEGDFDHGLVYAEAAIGRGAIAVLCDAQHDQYCQQILSRIMTRAVCVPVKDLQLKLGELANKFYESPSEKLFVSGVTGTDGKTSVSHFIAQAMNAPEAPAALIGTLGNGLINKLEESTHTTPDVFSVHSMVRQYLDGGAKSVAMEVSSHGLDQDRVQGLNFDAAVLTNLTRDHLDYHGDIESYKKAKKKLFIENNDRTLVLNADDAFGSEIFSELKNQRTIWLYGLNEEQVKQSKLYVHAINIANKPDGMSFMLVSSHGTAEINVGLIGEFNIYNVLACFCVLMQSGMNFNHAINRIVKLQTVPGRMEVIAEADKPTVVVDYAHTPEALSQALISVRKHVTGKIICVFGCGGDRDAGKRPLMAQVADNLSDLVIVTSDNPRNEDSAQIIDEVTQGISNELKLIVEEDRAKAIQQAISMASLDDLVLIAGKGHEQYQIVANKKFAFSDMQKARESLEAYS